MSKNRNIRRTGINKQGLTQLLLKLRFEHPFWIANSDQGKRGPIRTSIGEGKSNPASRREP